MAKTKKRVSVPDVLQGQPHGNMFVVFDKSIHEYVLAHGKMSLTMKRRMRRKQDEFNRRIKRESSRKPLNIEPRIAHEMPKHLGFFARLMERLRKFFNRRGM